MAGTVSPGRAVIAAGLGAARAHVRLVALVWAVLLVISVAAVWPAWRWWSATLGPSLEGDRLLFGLDLAVIKEMSHYDRTGTFGIVETMAFAAAFLALLLNPFFSAGFIGVLADREAGLPAPRFFARGARHYWSFLRALLYVVLAGAAVLGVALSVSTAIVARAADSGFEYLMIGLALAEGMLAGLLVAFFVAILDVARVRLVLDDSRQALRAVARALVFVPRHLASFAGLGLVYLVFLAALAAAVFGLQALLPSEAATDCRLCAGSWMTIVLGAIFSQIFGFGRAWLRVAALASELALVEARWPVALAAPLPAEESAPAPLTAPW